MESSKGVSRHLVFVEREKRVASRKNKTKMILSFTLLARKECVYGRLSRAVREEEKEKTAKAHKQKGGVLLSV